MEYRDYYATLGVDKGADQADIVMVLRLPDQVLAIAEADVRDTAAMYLTNPSGSWTGHWVESP